MRKALRKTTHWPYLPACLPVPPLAQRTTAHYVANDGNTHGAKAMARQRRAPKTSNGIIIGRRAMAETFGCSTRTIDRWIADLAFPAAMLPSGHLCTTATLIDLWLLGRLKHGHSSRTSVPGQAGTS
jgi:hypothetical protein